jgi:hypothetical protein
VETLTSLLESAIFGNMLNIAGIVLTLIGFWITISSSWKARDAADLARCEVAKVRDDLRKVNTVADISQALFLIEECKKLHRDNKWPLLPDKYSALKHLLITIRSTYTDFSEDQKSAIQSTTTELTNIEVQIEKFLSSQKIAKSIPDASKLNTALTKHSDNLREILAYIRNDIGGNYDNTR